MANEYFTPSGYPATGAAGSSASMRSELALVEDGFDKLPTLTGNGGKIVAVNSGGTGLTTSATLSESGGTMTVTGNLSVTGDTTLGNASGDALTIASSAVTWSGNPTHSGNHTFSGGLTLASPLPTSSGGTGLSSFTANRVFYASSTSAIGSSANLTFDGTTLATSAFTATGNVNLNGGTFVFNDAGADLDARFEGDTDPALLFLDAGNDRVGIGTNTPNAPLQLNKTGVQLGVTTAYLTTRLHETSADVKGVSLGYDSGSQTGIVLGNTATASSNLAFWTFQSGGTGWAERMRITAAGDVGIGITNPGSPLHVVGPAANPQIRAGDGNVLTYAAYSLGTGASAVNYYGTASNHPTAFLTNNVECVRIATNGDVGIGNAGQPIRGNLDISAAGAGGSQTRSIHFGYSAADFYGYRLTAVNDATSTAAGTFSIQRGTTAAWVDVLTSDNSGNVGIGTTTPSTKLHVDTGAAGYGVTIAASVQTARTYQLGVDANNSLAIYDTTAAAQRLVVASGGDVGIGTNSPSAKLHVSGTGAQALWISTLTSGDPSMSLRAEGVNAGSMTYRRSDSNFVFDNGAATFLASDASLNVVAGAGAVATTASNGFFYVPTCAGTPTGTPTAKTGYAPIVVDTTNNKLYFYSGGQWRDAGP